MKKYHPRDKKILLPEKNNIPLHRYELLKREAAKYTRAKDFKKHSYTLYCEASQYGVLKELTAPMKTHHRARKTDSQLLREYSKMDYRDGGKAWTTYLYLRERGLLKEAKEIQEKVARRQQKIHRQPKTITVGAWTIEKTK